MEFLNFLYNYYDLILILVPLYKVTILNIGNYVTKIYKILDSLKFITDVILRELLKFNP